MHFILVPGCWQSTMFLIFKLFFKNYKSTVQEKWRPGKKRKNKGTKTPTQKLKKERKKFRNKHLRVSRAKTNKTTTTKLV